MLFQNDDFAFIFLVVMETEEFQRALKRVEEAAKRSSRNSTPKKGRGVNKCNIDIILNSHTISEISPLVGNEKRRKQNEDAILAMASPQSSPRKTL